ncbi:MAG TPA: hypothetical protein VL728_19520 [Cyclobacteriaceae bacterium]|jgi:hypothetical protein|nr:hypothetical protein [Cyclobacteriaceae bacterium]
MNINWADKDKGATDGVRNIFSDDDANEVKQAVNSKLELIVLPIPTAGGNIILDAQNFIDLKFNSSANITSDKAISLTNFANCQRFTWLFTSDAHTLTFSGGTFINKGNPEWNGTGFVLTDPGYYKITGEFDGTNWLLKLE